jgi:UDP-sugar transporter A1/2/3
MVNDAYMKEDGTPLHGFTFAVWASILTNAAGGMIVATVMKFAGNILRNFAQACAIIVGGFGSWLLFDFVITARFVGGVALVSAIVPFFFISQHADPHARGIHAILSFCPILARDS